MKTLLMIASVCDGLACYGPYDTVADAQAAGERQGEVWWTVACYPAAEWEEA